MSNIKNKVYEILSEHFYISQSEVSDSLAPGDLPTWDSLGQIQLILKLEEKFSTQFSVDEVMSINNVKDIVKILENHSSTNGGKGAITTSKITTNPLILPKMTFVDINSILSILSSSIKKVAIVSTQSKYSIPIKDKIKSILKDKDILIFEKQGSESTEESILEIYSKLNDFKPDLVISIGGGSILDSSKIAILLVENENLNLENITQQNKLPTEKKQIKFLAIPTIFGSGAEVSSSAVFNKKDSLGKNIVFSSSLLPDYVLIDSSSSKNLNKKLILSGAFDALTHCIEGYVSIIDHPLVRPYSIYGIKELLNLILTIEDNDSISEESLESLSYLSFYGGIVQNHNSVGLTHAIAHQTNSFGLLHGQANAFFLNEVIKFNLKTSNKYSSMVSDCGLHDIKNLISKIDTLVDKSSLIPEKDILKELLQNKENIAESALNDRTIRTNPAPPTKNDIIEIISTAVEKYL